MKFDFSLNKQVKDFVSELRTLQTALESQGILVGFRRSHGAKLVTVKKGQVISATRWCSPGPAAPFTRGAGILSP